jgi:hypothetical protein
MGPIAWMLFHKINPEENERRFYYLEVGSSLVDEHAVLRVWGRIGGHIPAYAGTGHALRLGRSGADAGPSPPTRG